jgi:hypothetical protein
MLINNRPIMSAFHVLPKTNVPFTDDDLIDYECPTDASYSNALGNYDNLCELISEIVDGDCWAVTVGDEILFNSYDPNISVKDNILNSIIRRAIIDNPHVTILCDINRKKLDTTIKIYMFGNDSWSLVIKYSQGVYNTSYFKQ